MKSRILIILMLLFPIVCTAEDAFCPICGNKMECHDLINNNYLTYTYASNVLAIYKMHCDWGLPLIEIKLPNCCEECRKKYGPAAKFYEDQLNSFWKRTVQENEGARKEAEIQRRDAQIKSLQNEIKRLKGE